MGRKKTQLEKVKTMTLWKLKDGKDELLLRAYCVALGVLTPKECDKAGEMDADELYYYLKYKKAQRIKQLEDEQI